MKKVFLLLAFFSLLFPKFASAHGSGLPAFFKINGKYSIPSPLVNYGVTASKYLVIEDLGPENYLVDTPIHFEIDKNQLLFAFSSELLSKATFDWNFGDGTSGSGSTNTHSYLKMGSYILSLSINISPKDQNPTPIQIKESFLLTILPQKNYSPLPKPVLTVNGKEVADPATNVVEENYNNTITFDILEPKNSSQIVKYQWSFGDGETSTQKSVSHKYVEQTVRIARLRITDSDGFISDGFVILNHNSNIKNPEEVINKEKNNFPVIPVIISVFIGIVLISGFYTVKRKRK